MSMAKRKKNPMAVALGRKGGKASSKARLQGLKKEDRSEAMRKVVRARWAGCSPMKH